MRLIFFILFIILSFNSIYGQNPDGFEQMATSMINKKTPSITMNDVQKLQKEKQKIIFLDSREQNEFSVSHLPGAIWVGYDHIDWTKIDKLDKKATVVIYCSVGFRSGKLTDQLKKKGFIHVKNLYGGLFNWVNNGGKIVNSKDNFTTEVHGYNKDWSKWVNEERYQIVL